MKVVGQEEVETSEMKTKAKTPDKSETPTKASTFLDDDKAKKFGENLSFDNLPASGNTSIKESASSLKTELPESNVTGNRGHLLSRHVGKRTIINPYSPYDELPMGHGQKLIEKEQLHAREAGCVGVEHDHGGSALKLVEFPANASLLTIPSAYQAIHRSKQPVKQPQQLVLNESDEKEVEKQQKYKDMNDFKKTTETKFKKEKKEKKHKRKKSMGSKKDELNDEES